MHTRHNIDDKLTFTYWTFEKVKGTQDRYTIFNNDNPDCGRDYLNTKRGCDDLRVGTFNTLSGKNDAWRLIPVEGNPLIFKL
jgi:hypothetical protein